MGVAFLNAWEDLHRHNENRKDAPMRHQKPGKFDVNFLKSEVSRNPAS
jgi:hypothetical protein